MNNGETVVLDVIGVNANETSLFSGGNTRIIFDMLGEGAYCVNRERRVIHWNGAAEKITGYPAGEVVGSYCFQKILQHIDCAGRDMCSSNELCPLYLTMHDNTTREESASFLHKDGRRVPVRLKTVPIADSTGLCVGALELFHEDGVVENLREQVAGLMKKAHIDCLTGLPNRHSIDAHLRQSIDEWERYGWSFACFLADIDHFKQINDTFGHDVGDLAISTVMNTIALACRSSDFVGRLGGDESVGILKDVDKSGLAVHLHRLNVLVQKSRVVGPPLDISATVSIGGTLARSGDTPQSILKRADEALYISKKTGRDRYAIV